MTTREAPDGRTPATCPHRCCPYSHMRRPRISRGQCECRCHDGRCENREQFHADECICAGDYYEWPHHMTTCPESARRIAARKAQRSTSVDGSER